MIKSLIKAAADLDQAGFHVEADLMDKIMHKVAQELDEDMDEMEESEEEEDSSDESDFGFLGHDDSDEDSEEDDYEEESDEEEDGEHSVEECMTYCTSFSDAQKVELIKALLDSMDH